MKTHVLNLQNEKALIGFYFHIPFCPHICPYCNFVKTSLFKKKSVVNYFSLCKESLEEHVEKVPTHYKKATIYFGGGTPGLFEGKYFESMIRILAQRFQIVEFTIETNPYTNKMVHLESYKDVGANRLTLGAQSLNSKVLKLLGRRHCPDDILLNLKQARKIGFKNIQMDFIFGVSIPHLERKIKSEIERALDSGATGISSYALTLEKNTQFHKKTEFCSSDEKSFEDYMEIHETCKKLGLNHLETSNYSFFDMQHNSIYWHGLPYIGIGLGAHGLLPASKKYPFGRRYHVGPKQHSYQSMGDFKLNFEDKINGKKTYFKMNYERIRTFEDSISELCYSYLRTNLGLEKNFLESIKEGTFEHLSHHPKILKGIECNQINGLCKKITLTTKGKFLGDRWALDIIDIIFKYLKS